MTSRASSLLSAALMTARATAYYERLNLQERVGAVPFGARGTRAFAELEDARTRLSRLILRSYETVGPELRALEAEPWKVAPAKSAEERRAWRSTAVAALGGHVDGDRFAGLALEVGLALGALALAAELARSASFALPAGSADTLLRDELELQGRLSREASAALEAALDRLDDALDPSTSSPSVGEATRDLRTALAKLPVIARDGAAGDRQDLARWIALFFATCNNLAVALGHPPEPLVLPPPSAEELELARRIPGEPENLALRQAFATLAIGRGDPRGVLVREQAQNRDRQLRLRIRGLDESDLSRDLVRRHPEWSEEIRLLGATNVRFWSGFIEEITISARAFLDGAPKLFAAAPIRFAKISCPRDEAPALLACPWLERLVALDLSGNDWTSRELEQLADCNHAGSLRALDLSHNRIDAGGLSALAASKKLPRLAHVGLDGTAAGPLFTLEYTLQEIPTQEWLSTEVCRHLQERHGPVPWVVPWEGMPSLYEL